jgi:hypothetical protein
VNEQLYREPNRVLDEVRCPSCKQSIVTDNATTATCSHCDRRFAIDPTPDVALVRDVAKPLARRDAARPWIVGGSVLASFILVAVSWGVWGVGIGFVIALVALIAESARR